MEVVTDQTIQIILQAGAIGILLVFGFGAYRLAMRFLNMGETILTNHFDHLVGSLAEVKEALVSFESKLERLVGIAERGVDTLNRSKDTDPPD